MTRKDSQGRRLCTATTNKGQPCRGPAIKNATVCRKHGGQLPEVKAKAARTRLEELVDPVIVEWRSILESPKTSPAVKVLLGKHILDYAGYRPVVRVEGVPTLAMVEAWIEEAEAEKA